MFTCSQFGAAASCTGGTLADYLALGSTGCTIGGDTVSSFALLSGTTGASELAAGSVGITPTGGGFAPTFTFTTSQTAGANSLIESIFTYKLSGVPFTSAALSLSGSSETVDGAVTEIEDYCAGGSFGPDGVSGCTGTANSLLTLDGIQNVDQGSFGAVSFLSVTNDFTLDGGSAGSAAGGVFTNSFSAVPEPGSILFMGLGLALTAGAGLRKSRAFSKK